MIKVEIEGNRKYIRCNNCSSILSFERGDELRRVDHCYIECPICLHNVITRYERESGIWMIESKNKLSDF